MMARMLQTKVPPVQERWPRQCQAIAQCIQRLNQLERENCPNPDEPAGAFGELMAQILTYQQDLWAPSLAQMGFALGRFIYLVDAAVDYDRDKRQKRYNPFLAMGMKKIGNGGKNTWCWPWDGAPNTLSGCPWFRTRAFWTTFSTAGFG